MIMLISTLPKVCPVCSADLTMGKYAMHDWLHKSSFSCDCGLRYQYVEEDKLLALADSSGGDMKMYHNR